MIVRPSPLSGNDARLLFTHKVLGKYNAEYFYDEAVGYIFVGDPYWLEEAYSSAIAITDTGVLQRNMKNIDAVSRALVRHRHPFTKGVDLGGGYGLFVRGMRDVGFDFYWTDKYSDNLLARGFAAAVDRHSTATAFEFLEHLDNPLAVLKAARDSYGFDTCFFSATCFREDMFRVASGGIGLSRPASTSVFFQLVHCIGWPISWGCSSGLCGMISTPSRHCPGSRNSTI